MRLSSFPLVHSLPRAKGGLAAVVSKSFHRAFVRRGYREKRNLITDFCDKTGSSPTGGGINGGGEQHAERRKCTQNRVV